MTNPRRILSWLVAIAVFAAVGGGALVFWLRRPPPLALPAEVAHGKLSPLLREKLQSARDQARAHPRAAGALRALAHLYHANRLNREARSCYQLVAATAGGLDARDHYYLADLALADGDLESAQRELAAVLAKEPHYLAARLMLAEALFKSGRADAAAAAYTAILAAEPDHPQAALGLARYELQQGNDAAAVARLEALLAVHLESASAAGLLSQLMTRRGETERAAALAQLSRQKREPAPADPWLEALLLDCYDGQRLALKFEELLDSGQLAVALPLLDRVETLDPKSWTPQLLRGWSLARSQRDRDAVQQYQVALDKGGDPERIVPMVVVSMLAQKQSREALAFAAGWHARRPDSTEILRAYAELAERAGEATLAKALLTKLLAKDPYLYRANLSLAKLLWSTSDHDRAVQCVERVAKAFPADVASRGLLAEHFLERAEPLSAIAPLEQAMPVAGAGPARDRLTAMLESAYLQAGEAESHAGRFAEAAELFAKASRLVPTQLEAYAGEANAATQLKEFRRAADALRKIAALQPENPTVELSLGDVLYQTGETANARTHWQRALQLAAAGDAELRAALAERLDGHITTETFR